MLLSQCFKKLLDNRYKTFSVSVRGLWITRVAVEHSVLLPMKVWSMLEESSWFVRKTYFGWFGQRQLWSLGICRNMERRDLEDQTKESNLPIWKTRKYFPLLMLLIFTQFFLNTDVLFWLTNELNKALQITKLGSNVSISFRRKVLVVYLLW